MKPAATAAEKKPDNLVDRALVTAFLENVPEAIYFKDRESRFIAVSKSTALKHGFTPLEMIGKTDFDLFSEAHARPAYEDEQKIIRSGEPIMGKLEQETWPDGRVTWALSSKMPLRDGQGAIIGTFGLGKDVTESKRMELALEKAQKELVDASRLAGMAEVATGVLHNVGNVLNSLNVSATVIADGLRKSRIEGLAKISAMLRERAGDIGEFITKDPKGKLVPAYLETLVTHTSEERTRLLDEVEALQKNIDHIKDIVTMQQAYATMKGIVEPLDATQLVEDAVRMNLGALARHDVHVARDFKPSPHVVVEKGKVLQILINLIRNAKYACDEAHAADGREKMIELIVRPGGPKRVHIAVRDMGIGIPAENLTRIFSHGFTTRSDGHGFGLHASALAAREMGGSLMVSSDGHGKGAQFTLHLPAVD